jgi:hypothetical protein
MSKSGFVALTDADSNEPVLLYFGNGGVIKALAFADQTVELYNITGEMVCKVKEDIAYVTAQL